MIKALAFGVTRAYKAFLKQQKIFLELHLQSALQSFSPCRLGVGWAAKTCESR